MSTASPNRIDEEIDTLATFSEHPAPAVTRILYSDQDLAARRWLIQLALDAGLTVREDPVGNTFFRWQGSDPSLPAVATGSHIDAIPHAGKYDGTVGVLGGLEALRLLRTSGHQPQRSLELILFTAEEPTRFGLGCLGSRLLAATLPITQARLLTDPSGQTLDTLRTQAGFSGPLEDVALHPGHYHAFIELHIEQGPILDQTRDHIGVVTKIAAPAAFRLHFSGTGGHAGAVLMQDRHDAFLAAAEVALAVEKAAKTSGSPDTVGTTGNLKVLPGAINSIPCNVMMEIDFRDTDLITRDRAIQQIRKESERICHQRGVAFSWETISQDPPATCAPAIVSLISDVAASFHLRHRQMISRAYHDSLFMAHIAPTAMIFIPCHLGYSHRPDEYASPQAIHHGVRVLAETLRQLSR